jgi:hypothetical protein
LARPAEALAHALVMNHKTLHGLCPSCLHRTRRGVGGGLIRYLVHDDIPMATDGDDISIHRTEEMEKYDSPPASVWSHSCI